VAGRLTKTIEPEQERDAAEPPMPLIDDFDSRFILGVPAIDRSHREMVELINQMDGANDATFVYLFMDLVNHTRAHFASEEVMMRESLYTAIAEHKDEHARVLAELSRFYGRLGGVRTELARAYVREQMAAWFALHATTLDSALVAHLKRVRSPAPVRT
jgi:hemerythrin